MGVVLLYAALVYAAVVVVRFAWFFTTSNFHPVFDRLLHSRYLRAPWQERLVMSWSGMRGAVSLAAALAVPAKNPDAGDPFPGRDLIVFLTFSVILATPGPAGSHLGSADSGAAPGGAKARPIKSGGAPGPPRRRPRGPR